MIVKSSLACSMFVLTSMLLLCARQSARVFVKSRYTYTNLGLTNMKVTQSAVLPSHLLDQSRRIGELLARLRLARRIKQTDAALRAGLSRNTAYRIEQGDPGLAIGQVLRYLEAIAPGSTLVDLLTETDPALVALTVREQTRRVRDLSSSELDELNF